MIAVSSFRPLDENHEYAANQLKAKATWDGVFTGVIYFNQWEPRLASDNTLFLGDDTHPTIKSMTTLCSTIQGWSCIINADIQVSPRLSLLEHIAHKHRALALTSYRYEISSNVVARTYERGLDFFAAQNSVWSAIAKMCPPDLRIGHAMWDNWMVAAMNDKAWGRFFDITSSRCIFHPKHGGRLTRFNVTRPNGEGDFYGMPQPLEPFVR